MNCPITNINPAQSDVADTANVWSEALRHGTLAAGLISDCGIWQECNDSLCAFLGYPAGMLRGTQFDAVVSPDDARLYLDERRRLHEGSLYSVRANRIFIRKDCSRIWGEIFLLRTSVAELLLAEVTAAGCDRAKWQRTCLLADLLARASNVDDATVYGEFTRRTGKERAVLFCGIDGFNAPCGGASLDSEAIKRIVAKRIQASLRKTDRVAARSSGNDLMVVLSGLHGVADALTVAEKLCTSTAVPIPFLGGDVSAAITIVVAMSSGSDAAAELVRRADEAMAANRFSATRVLSVD